MAKPNEDTALVAVQQIQRHGRLFVSSKTFYICVEIAVSTSGGSVDPSNHIHRVFPFGELDSLAKSLSITDTVTTLHPYIIRYRRATLYRRLLHFLHEFGLVGVQLEKIPFWSISEAVNDATVDKLACQLRFTILQFMSVWGESECCATPRERQFDQDFLDFEFIRDLPYPKLPPFYSVERLLHLGNLIPQGTNTGQPHRELEAVIQGLFNPTDITYGLPAREWEALKQRLASVADPLIWITRLFTKLLAIPPPVQLGEAEVAKFWSRRAFQHSHNIYIYQVPVPANAFHICFQAFRAAAGGKPGAYQFLVCNEETDFIAFNESMDRYPEEAVFLVFLPEFLRKPHFRAFLTAVNSRFLPVPDRSKRKWLVITSFEIPNCDQDCLTVVDRNLISETRNSPNYRQVPATLFHVVQSTMPGDGKSSYVSEKCQSPCVRYFLNETHQQLPPIEEHMHFCFSEEMFDHGIIFWESLYFSWYFRVSLFENHAVSPALKQGEIWIESPLKPVNPVDFPPEDLPFPIVDDNIHTVDPNNPATGFRFDDHFADRGTDQPIDANATCPRSGTSREYHTATAFNSGFDAACFILKELGLDVSTIKSTREYLRVVYPIFFKVKMPDISTRIFSYIQKYLSKFT
jgi:hypothetical protein